jgi:Fe-S cluster assembly ATPase SufC
MVVFLADGVKITSRSSDGTVTLSFSTGEYQRQEITNAFLFAQSLLDQSEPVKITLSGGEDEKNDAT